MKIFDLCLYFKEMASYKWGVITTKENSRGRGSVFFLIREDILQDESCIKKLMKHGVGKEELEEALFNKEKAILDEVMKTKVNNLYVYKLIT